MENKVKIKNLTKSLLEQSYEAMLAKIDKALNSGAIDLDSWSEDDAPMLLPKAIVIAILEDEAAQYDGRGTSFDKKVKKEAKNIRYFL